MHQFLESVLIALQAIWANKLRSFLTVLGNIVAVTSIIAVVSLVQGLNASVKDVIQSEIGADTFSVQQFGLALSEEDFLKMQSNPIITFDDAEAIREYAQTVRSVMVTSDTNAQVKFRNESLDSVDIQGVTKEYVARATTNIELGRSITSTEFESGRYVAILGWDSADKLFGPLDPLNKTVSIEGVHFQ